MGDGTIGELRSRAKEYERTLISVPGEKEAIERQLSNVSGVNKVEFVGEDSGCVSFRLYSPIDNSPWRELNELARSQSWELRQLADRPLTLEETFLTLTEKAGLVSN